MKTCSIGRCEKPSRTRGLCSTHYQRWRRHGDPLGGGERFATPEDAFEARTEPLCWSDCIVWTGVLNRGGYGRLQVNGRMVLAHRYAYEREHGPISEGAEVDHTCWNRACVNPEHLRLATRSQNGANLSGAHRGRDLPRGVYRSGRGYRAQVKHNGQYHCLGTFSTPEAASTAAQTKRALLFGEYAGGA